MECSLTSIVWLAISFSAALLLLFMKRFQNVPKKSRPPGPPALPLIGNMLDLGAIPHQALYKLQPKYGPVIWLQLGTVGTMVVQSAKAAAELFKNHDLPFAERKCPGALTAHGYNQGSLAVGNYGAYWRVLRRLCFAELLISKRINDTASVRRKCIDDMIRWIEEESEASKARGAQGEVNVPHLLFLMAFNLVGNLMFSKDLLNSKSEKGQEFFDAMNKIMEWAGKPNVADFLPFLKWVDPQGIQKGMMHDMGRAIKIAAGFVLERTQEEKSEKEKAKKDFLDALLEFEGDAKEAVDKMSDKKIKIIILEMFFAGSETTSSSMEWALTELLRNPEVMKKAKEELDSVVGTKKKVEESNIDKMPYLQAIIKETLRLHPPLPLLLPRNALEDTKYLGYHIPKNTQILVNAWAIGRDPEIWDDPLNFKPERFLGSNIDYKGQHFGLIPFGSGRRICIGMSLAHRVLHLAVASLLHCFEWELDGQTTPETIDLDERMGITVRKLVPLKAIPRKRNDTGNS